MLAGGAGREESESEFGSLARDLAVPEDSDEVLRLVVEAAILEVDGATDAGITLITKHGFDTPAFTSDLVVAVDKVQYAVGEGPCVMAASEEIAVVRADDVSTDPRWPLFGERAVALGVRSMVSFQLYADADTIGALNLYSPTPNAFSDDAVNVGGLIAAHAALATAAATKTTNLRAALHNRDVIGMAKGILIERYKATPLQAFALLSAASQRAGVKLSAVADSLTTSGEFVVGARVEPPGDRADDPATPRMAAESKAR